MSAQSHSATVWQPAQSNFGNDWLSSMHEVWLPQALSGWPPGPLVWWVLAMLILYLGNKLWQKYQHWNKNAYRRAAIQQLQRLQHNINEKNLHAWRQLPSLIRQVALVTWPRSKIVPLIGDDWLQFLSQTCAMPTPAMFTQLAYLSDSALQKLSQPQQQQIITWCQHWITKHEAPSP